MQPITKAVILAAGLGLRLRDVFSDSPKGLLAIENVPLIERSIQQLVTHGINDITIVTGYLAEEYEALANIYPYINTVHNPHFAESGSMYSLYCSRELINEPFLLLESDLLYEDRSIYALLDASEEDIILASDETNSGDEVFIEAEGGFLRHMSKKRHELTNVMGELVGISKISNSLLIEMFLYAEKYFESDYHLHYEDCLTSVAALYPISICLLPNLVWTEIDNREHLQHAKNVIWPKICKIEQTKEM